MRLLEPLSPADYLLCVRYVRVPQGTRTRIEPYFKDGSNHTMLVTSAPILLMRPQWLQRQESIQSH